MLMQETPFAAELTAGFDLPHVVAGEPARLAAERPLPPAAVLLPHHVDQVAFVERQLILIVVLEVEASLHQQLPASSVLRHLLLKRRERASAEDLSAVAHVNTENTRNKYVKKGTVPLIWIVYAESLWTWQRRACEKTSTGEESERRTGDMISQQHILCTHRGNRKILYMHYTGG